MSSETIFLYNAIAYTITLLFLYYKYKLSLGLILWGAYTISAWSTWLFVQQPMYWESMHYSKHTIFPCIYLFVLILLSIFPLCKISRLQNVEFNNISALKKILIACIVIQTIFIIVDIPSVIRVLTTQSDLGSLREEAYARDGDKGLSFITQNALLNKFYLFYSGIRPLVSGLSVFLYFLCKKERKTVKVFLATTFIENLWHITILVGRGEMVITSCIYGCTLFLLRDYLSKKVKKILMVYITPIIFLGAAAFWAITISRFGDYASFYMYKYMGESMNNFCGILYPGIQGHTDGQAYFSYVYRYLFGEVSWVDTESRYLLIEKITKIPAFIFYTYIGGLIIEFGKIIPVFIIIAFNRMVNKIVLKKKIGLGIVIIYIALIYCFTYGIFTFPAQNFVGMGMLVFISLFCYLFRTTRY